MPNPSMIFVGDEPRILREMRGMIHGRSNGRSTIFAFGAREAMTQLANENSDFVMTSMHMRDKDRLALRPGGGREALALLGRKKIDIVVTDMRMPKMDGAALLAEVARLYPNTVRFVLSGQSDEESTMRAIGPSHQYLSKPCDGALLESKIDRALSLRKLIRSPDVRTAISKLNFVPSPPEVFHRLTQEFRAIQTDAEQVGAIFASDPALSAQILKVANSAYFGLARAVRLPSDAVRYLGVDVIRALVLSHGVVGEMQHAETPSFSARKLIEHCQAVGFLARRIASVERINRDELEGAFIAGMLHDIGQLVLAENFPTKYAIILDAARRNAVDLGMAETEQFGANHAEIGAYLLGLWGLPDPIVEAVAYHHDATAFGRGHKEICAIVNAANALMTGVPEPARAGTDRQILSAVPDERRSIWIAIHDELRVLEGEP